MGVNSDLSRTSSDVSSFGEWLRPSRTVPRTAWSASGPWRPTATALVALLAGLWLFGTGEAALVAAGIGVSPWTVLAQGISRSVGIDLGVATFWVSLAVLSLWWPLRRRPGLGTVLNIVVIAIALDVMVPVFPKPTSPLLQVVEALLGVGIVGAGSAFYITSNLGPGPRDGLMTGLHDRTGVRIGRVRLAIEVVVLTVGWLLGGTVGIGTVLFGLLVGQAVAVGFGMVSRLS